MRKRYHTYISRNEGTFKPATENEIKEMRKKQKEFERLYKKLEKTKKQFDDLRKNCTHKVFYDEWVYPWTFRRCPICGYNEHF